MRLTGITHIILLALASLFLTQDLQAQKKLKNERINHNGNHEFFHKTRGKKGVRHGEYERTTVEGMQIIEAGNYDMGRKVGTWHYFFRTRHDPILEQIYDHDLDSLLYTCTFDRAYVAEFGTQMHPVTFDSPAIHVGGEELLYNLIIDQVDLQLSDRHFDEHAYLESKPNGRVGISFMIGKNGRPILPVVATSLNPICDALVLDAVKALETRWIPATRQGKATATGKTIYIEFSYSESLNYSGPVRQMIFVDRMRPAQEEMHIAK